MKRIRFISMLFSVCVCALALPLFSACRQQEKEIDAPYMGTLSVVEEAGEHVTLYVEKTVYQSKEAKGWLERAESAYTKFYSAFGIDRCAELRVIEDEYALGEDGVALCDGFAYCNPSAFETGEYLFAFAGEYLQRSESWKRIAAVDYVYSERDGLGDTFTEGLGLTLFEGYFNDAFADEETQVLAANTAKRFGRYVIEEYGIEAFLDCGVEEYRNEWLISLGKEGRYQLPFDLSWLDGARYSERFLQFPLTIECKNQTYCLDAITSSRSSSAFDTPELVLTHLSNGIKGMEEIVEHVRAQAEGANTRLSLRYGESIAYEISDRRATGADVEKGVVYLADPSEFVHETVHMLTLDAYPRDGLWLAEGVAEYYSRDVSGVRSDIEYRMYDSFTEWSETQTSLGRFVESVKAEFSLRGGNFATFGAFDFSLLEECIARVTFESSEKVEGFAFATSPVSAFHNSPPSSYEGNGLTYPQAYLFTKYLIEQEGEVRVLNALPQGGTFDFTSSFGRSYAEYFAEFLSTL